MRWHGALALVIGFVAVCPPSASALEPRDVFVLVNRNLPESQDVANPYRLRRGVPAENLISLDLPNGEEINRDDYNRRIVAPVREALKARRGQAKVLLSVYGVPLRVGAQSPTEDERKELSQLKPELDKAQAEAQKLLQTNRVLEAEVKKDPDSPLAPTIPERQKALDAAQRKVGELEDRQRRLSHAESVASVDSELMLLWWDNYPLYRWILNPLYWQFPEQGRRQLPPVLMTCRLDGPTPEIAKRLVDDAVAVEAKGGLSGKVYVDARGIAYTPE